MAVQTRAIKRRIKSVKNTRKITKAMELVAASKMRKAVSAVSNARPFSQVAWNTVRLIAQKVDTSLHPLLARSKTQKNVFVVLMTSDRGLAGGFNSNVIRKARDLVKSLKEEVSVRAICVGKRGTEAMKRMKIPVTASFDDLTNKVKFEDIVPIAKFIMNEFIDGKVDTVYIVTTDFVSAMTQKPIVTTLLPLDAPEVINESAGSFLFEPSPQEVLNALLPRIMETMMFQSVLESSASEHSARMMAMRSASDAAAEMIDDLTFTFNQARQAGITQEIAEISSGKAALEN